MDDVGIGKTRIVTIAPMSFYISYICVLNYISVLISGWSWLRTGTPLDRPVVVMRELDVVVGRYIFTSDSYKNNLKPEYYIIPEKLKPDCREPK
jgi:hypothetical protein